MALLSSPHSHPSRHNAPTKAASKAPTSPAPAPPTLPAPATTFLAGLSPIYQARESSLVRAVFMTAQFLQKL